MEPGKRAVVLAAVIAYIHSRRRREKSRAATPGYPVRAWRLARLLDAAEEDVTCQG
ncbi:hypothetical protein IG193_06760 [Infirmifilum lucidum]|uniref:Uncharacterized protein n=1 Tax=Infirmifilum lucidum TaxID=2776706 RepID=A0A7L9FFR9_9CREN|nr:hypothetical protein [Infirmifilum lucidum]QOJ78451.1 hypothetical protein IG193_06760 [Infirmifilum lucidum]